nr:MAG TPA: hypothetical protein [Caudoviricetes sp.]
MPIRILRGKLFVGIDRELFFFFVKVGNRNIKHLCEFRNVLVGWRLPSFPSIYRCFRKSGV